MPTQFESGNLNEINKDNSKKVVIDGDQRKEEAHEIKSDLAKSSWIVVTDVPSKMLAYPGGVEIAYRPYKFGEIKNYNDSSKLSPKEQMDFILSGVKVDGIDIYDLTLSDFLFIGLLRRLSSIGDSEIIVHFSCSKCQQRNQTILKSSSLDIEYLKVPELPIIVELSDGKEYHFNPLTLRNYMEAIKEGDYENTTGLLARCCINHNFKEVHDFIFNTTNRDDQELLEEVDKHIYHSVRPLEIKCSQKIRTQVPLTQEWKEEICDHLNSVEMEGGDIFLRPFRGDGKSPKDGIRFGV